MRTRTLLLAGALSLAGLATSLAQSNVYSLNVVGYYNLVLPPQNPGPGLSLIANQLDLDGTGNNNTLQTVFGSPSQLPNLSKIFLFDTVAGAFNAQVNVIGGNYTGSAAALAAANAAMKPGRGVFVQIPLAVVTPTTITIVGNVLQGTLTTPILAFSPALQLVSSQVPQQATIDTLGLTLGVGAVGKLFQWQAQKNAPGQNYLQKNALANGTWAGGAPTLDVGEAAFLAAPAGSSWTRNFTVQ